MAKSSMVTFGRLWRSPEVKFGHGTTFIVFIIKNWRESQNKYFHNSGECFNQLFAEGSFEDPDVPFTLPYIEVESQILHITNTCETLLNLKNENASQFSMAFPISRLWKLPNKLQSMQSKGPEFSVENNHVQNNSKRQKCCFRIRVGCLAL
jgi:hypothetical protein